MLNTIPNTNNTVTILIEDIGTDAFRYQPTFDQTQTYLRICKEHINKFLINEIKHDLGFCDYIAMISKNSFYIFNYLLAKLNLVSDRGYLIFPTIKIEDIAYYFNPEDVYLAGLNTDTLWTGIQGLVRFKMLKMIVSAIDELLANGKFEFDKDYYFKSLVEDLKNNFKDSELIEFYNQVNGL